MFGKWRSFHLGLNSQGVLLLPKDQIENLTLNNKKRVSLFSEMIYKIRSTYHKIKEKVNEDEIKKLTKEEVSSKFRTNIEHKDIKIIYVASSFIDKKKTTKILQVYSRLKLEEQCNVGVFEKTISKNFLTPWRFLGFLK
jgi:hypothetical protein